MKKIFFTALLGYCVAYSTHSLYNSKYPLTDIYQDCLIHDKKASLKEGIPIKYQFICTNPSYEDSFFSKQVNKETFQRFKKGQTAVFKSGSYRPEVEKSDPLGLFIIYLYVISVFITLWWVLNLA